MSSRTLLILLAICFLACKQESIVYQESFRGETMGTYYSVKIPGNKSIEQTTLDSILVAFNMQLSTYIDSSFISRVNDPLIRTKTCDKTENGWFFEMLDNSELLYEESEGAFDPTVMPLVNYWGFGPNRRKDGYKQEDIDSILNYIGLDKIQLIENEESKMVLKSDRRVSLDFSAIAKGYGVDVLAKYIENQAQKNYLVEIGGETRTRGHKADGKPWTLGINKPEIGADFNEIILVVAPGDHSMASSGNYRNYYSHEGEIFSHTIDPKTGMAIGSDLLAISVITDECWKADAIATACMVKGLEDSKKWVEEMNNVEACFFYAESDSIQYTTSSQFNKYIYK